GEHGVEVPPLVLRRAQERDLPRGDVWPEKTHRRHQLLDGDAERHVIEPGAALRPGHHGAGIPERQGQLEQRPHLLARERPVEPPSAQKGSTARSRTSRARSRSASSSLEKRKSGIASAPTGALYDSARRSSYAALCRDEGSDSPCDLSSARTCGGGSRRTGRASSRPSAT